jgi:hypothetical protein
VEEVQKLATHSSVSLSMNTILTAYTNFSTNKTH